jgi:hypothetical protein
MLVCLVCVRFKVIYLIIHIMFPPLPRSLLSRLSPIVLLLHLIYIYPSRLSVYYSIRVTAEAGRPRAWATYVTTLPIYGGVYIPIRVIVEAAALVRQSLPPTPY